MSCFDTIEGFSEEVDPNKKDFILDTALECYQNEEERRDKELKEFINDFVTSQEYAEYIEAKRNIFKRCKSTQYDINDVIVELKKRETVEKYPLTEEQKKMWAFKRQFEKFTERQRVESEVKKQEKSIQMIRSKINEARRVYECTNEEVQRKKRNHADYLMEKYSAKFNISGHAYLSLVGQKHLLERFKVYHHTLHNRSKKRQENVRKIICKIVKEYKLNKAIVAKEKRHLEYQPRKMERIVEGMDVVGTKVNLIDTTVKPPEVEPVEPIIEPEVVPEKPSKKKKSAGSEKSKKEKPAKKEKKKGGEKKSQKEKKIQDKEKKKDLDKLQFPIVPRVNPRQKVLPENLKNLLDLVEEFREFDSKLEDRDIWRREHQYILGDGGVTSKPNCIVFQNFDKGKTYKKTIVLTNVSLQTRKIRFEKFVFPDKYDEVVFAVENFGIQKLFIGCKVKFYVTFQPYDCYKCYDGKIVFLSYDNRKCQYYQFEVGIRCIPKYSDLKIFPEEVDFGAIPMWQAAEREHCKVLKLQNKGTKPCKIYIKKNFDPLDIEHLLEDENKENVVPLESIAPTTSYEEISGILDDCLKNVENYFQFETGFFSLGIGEIKKLKVFFKNASYIGNYFEQYTLEVYEEFLDGALNTAGCKVLPITAETTSHFLTTSPEVLDFGTCMLNSCYQLTFEVTNNSTSSQAVAIRVPAALGDTIRSAPAMVYLPPRGKRTVFLKFNPRDVLFRESRCQFYDRSCSILEYCIQICPVSKKSQDYPPVRVAVYAIIANFEDLNISFHTSSKHMTNFLNTLLIDMGECSIYEQIWAEISLTNNTFVTQICGFMDLPQAVTLEPNYGFCKLYPGQRKKFKLYFRPEIRDFPSYTVGTLRNSNFFFKLKVETLCSMGQILRDMDSNRIKSSMEMIKQLTMESEAENYSSMMGYVTELKLLQQHPTTESMCIPEGSCERVNSVIAGETHPSTQIHVKSVDTLLNYQNFVIVETDSRREMWIKINLKRPMVEFSHQIVEFPDTPCGSHSVMEIRLHALDKEMDRYCRKKKSTLSYKVQFQILGDSKEIFVEPSCGILKGGQSVKITLVAQPMVPQEIVEETARKLKYSEIYEMKLKEYTAGKKGGEKKAKKGAKKTTKPATNKDTKKGANSKVKSEATNDDKKDVPADQPNIVITEKELECDYLDYYPAEMVYWRNLEPYYISANFTCLLEYEHETMKMHKRIDKIFLEALCKVTRPDFSVNLNLQRIDFGACLVGSAVRKNIIVQNITYQNIQPQMSLLNPLGFFSIPYIRDLTVPPEHTLILPVQFRPTSAETVTEFVELKSNATTIPLILCGEGCEAFVKITPEFEVFRVETKANKLAEIQLKTINLKLKPR
ncbi:uncharacterized protein LOC126746816 isoform X2 [Anthonomus grandis grandis]|uniref:uncharacterized protein LOC126746816 isoform X2 n=1 Tax=Anthonomus grandis grandis TaxID=2921223 RepID=UPI0021654AAF|nr:uncharacterized protein LOC126746816 isoform X2 [Anthonomus grandis grandis]